MSHIIELEHIFDALKGFVRPLREGREAVNNLVFVGVRENSQKIIKIESFCLRTTKINEDPVKIEVTINKQEKVSVDEKIMSISCSCPAGASKEHCCKHAMAVLIYLEK